MRPQRLFLLTLLLILSPGLTGAFAQQASRRIEVAGGASVLRLTRSDATATGMAGRFSFDVTNWLSAEAEMAFFPSDDIIIRDRGLSVDFAIGHNRRRTDGFFGAKVGRRGTRYGLFGKVRPGFTHLTNQGVRCIGEVCTRMLILFAPDAYRTEFALDLGGGFEFYPSPRTVARFEFGDTMIRHRSMAPPCWNEACTSHNFATRVGGGLRF